MRWEQARLRALVEALTNGVFSVDTRGIVVRFTDHSSRRLRR